MKILTLIGSSPQLHGFGLLYYLKDNADAPVDRPEVRVDQDGVHRVRLGALPEGLAQADRPVVEAEEGGEGGGPD